jgi:hypothetical protein
MNLIQRTIGATVVSAALISTSGCDTGSGALAGAGIGAVLGNAIGVATRRPELGTAIGLAAGAATGAIIGSINEQQRARLQAESPQTLATIQHNDAVYQQQPQPLPPPQSTPGQQPAPPPDNATLAPFTVDDIKALDSSGVKKDVIIAEIQRSKTTYSPQDIAKLQQADPNIDPAVIDCMKQQHS